MPSTVYVPFFEINELQIEIMKFVGLWVREKNTVIPLIEIVRVMKKRKIKEFTTENAINGLVRKGYIRKAYTEHTNKTFFVQLRNI